MKSVLWRVAKRLSYVEDARCLKVNVANSANRPHPHARLAVKNVACPVD